MIGDNSASESLRSSSAHRRALERPIEPSPGWKGEARGEREDDELGADERMRKTSIPGVGGGHCGELDAEATISVVPAVSGSGGTVKGTIPTTGEIVGSPSPAEANPQDPVFSCTAAGGAAVPWRRRWSLAAAALGR
jgi:hypothetical protein